LKFPVPLNATIMTNFNFKLLIAACSVCTVASNVSAQQAKSDSVVFFTRSQVDSAARSTHTPEKPGRLLAASNEKESYLVVVRVKPGDVEAHEQFDDVAIIRSGHGILRSGFVLKGAKQTGKPGAQEWLGGEITDKRDRKVGAGDFIVIPAMLAHQYIPDAGDSLVYFTIKQRHPKK